MEDLLTTLLQAVITVATPIVAAYLVKALNAKAEELTERTQNEVAAKYIKKGEEAILTAVDCTAQTYVDGLKSSGQFSKENQMEAFEKARDLALSLLTKEAALFLDEAYGDLNNYLTSKIEAQIKTSKRK